MSLKPKTVRRLLLVAAVAALVIGSAFSLFVVRRWQTNRRTEIHRREGMAAFAAGNYRKSIQELMRYIQRGRTGDAEVWLTVAQAGQSIEDPQYAHLHDSVRALQQYLALRPGDKAQRMVLLKLCNQAGSYVEARDAAELLRPAQVSQAGPEHIEVLREEAIALTAARIYGDRLDQVVDRLLTLAPLDLQGHLIRLEFWGRTERTRDARRGAQALAAAHPDDPVAQLVFAASYLLEPTPDDLRIARAKLAQAVGLDQASGAVVREVTFPSADLASRAVDILDRLQAFDLSLAVLRRWHEQHPGPPADRVELGLLRTLARRLWQQNDRSALAAVLAEVPAERADSEVLAFNALALLPSAAAEDQRRARELARVLEGRTDDFRAATWVKVLQTIEPSGKADAKSNVEVLKAAIKATNRTEPVFLAMLGDAYASLARFDEAREAWKGAAELPNCLSWPYPHIRSAETHLAEGHEDEAIQWATSALMIAPDSPGINALWFEAQGAKLRHGQTGGPEVRGMLRTLERINSQVEAAGGTPEVRAIWERLLPTRVLFLARAGEPAQAVSIARSALDKTPRLSERTLQRLAEVSTSERLGIEQECLNRAAGESASPAMTLARAIELARAGRVEEGRALVQSAADRSGTPESWIGLAQYLEQIGSPDASAAWVRVGDRFPDEVLVQRACLGSIAAASDAAFIERSLARYQKLAGLDASNGGDAVTRVARARVLLRGGPGGLTLKDRDAAVALLAQVIAANPRLVEPKVALARALLIADPRRGIRADEARAAAQLADALAVQPRSIPIALELAALYQRTREPDKARELLARIASDANAESGGRQAAARMLLAQGGEQADLALRALEELDKQWQGTGQKTPPGVLIDLAEAYAQTRRDPQAQAVYERIVADDRADAEHLFLAAKYSQRRGQTAAVEVVLAKLDASGKPASTKALIRARLADDRGDLGAADRAFEEAVSAAPPDASAWKTYVSALVGRGRTKEAVEVAWRAVKAIPSDASLGVLLEQARLAAVTDGSSDFGPLLTAMSSDPTMAGASEVLKALDEAGRSGDLERADRIMDLSDRFPSIPGVQMFLAQKLAAIDPGKAAMLVSRARDLAPGDAKIAKAGAEVYLALGRWSDLINTATAWRDAEGGQTPEPDVAIAQARLNTRDYSGGLAALKPWLERAIGTPDAAESLSVLNMQTRLLIASGQEEQARAILQPLLASSASVRTAIWLRSAAEALPDVGAARSWIETVKPHLGADSAEEQVAVAGAWSVLATRFPDQSEALLAEANSVLTAAAQRQATATASVWEALGVVCHRQKNVEAARSAYERAIELDPHRPIPLNNLSSLLLDQGHDLARALTLAEQAAAASTDTASLTTLGAAHHAIGMRDPEGGAAAFKLAAAAFERAARLRPSDPQILARLAESAGEAGDAKAAMAAWEKVIELPGLPPLAVAGAKNNLAATMARSASGSVELQRARSLVDDALAAEQDPRFFDTLGWIELRSGRRQEAVEAFRKAVGKTGAEPPLSARVGLAAALSSGPEEGRREARELVSSIESARVSPWLREELQRARTALADDSRR